MKPSLKLAVTLLLAASAGCDGGQILSDTVSSSSEGLHKETWWDAYGEDCLNGNLTDEQCEIVINQITLLRLSSEQKCREMGERALWVARDGGGIWYDGTTDAQGYAPLNGNYIVIGKAFEGGDSRVLGNVAHEAAHSLGYFDEGPDGPWNDAYEIGGSCENLIYPYGNPPT